jgi:hypothetical protein
VIPLSDVYGMRTDKAFVSTLEDNIQKRSAMDKLISDCAKAELSSKAQDMLHSMAIDEWQSKPYH